MTRTQGTLRWYDKVRGLGFISIEGAQGVLVQERAINVPGRQVLRAGQTVEFDLVERDGRREAVNVVPIRA